MYKCMNCGREYDGEFCPECGTKRGGGKKCSCCGSINAADDKFCRTCGRSLAGGTANAYADSSAAKAQKTYQVLNIVPSLLFMLFALALFAFFAAPVAKENILGTGLGNIYSMFSSPVTDNSAVLASVAIIFAGVSVYAGIVCLTLTLCRGWKGVKILGLALRTFLTVIISALYLASAVVSCITIADINKFDGGMGLISAGACPVLVLVFSLLFLVTSVIVEVIACRLPKKYSLVLPCADTEPAARIRRRILLEFLIVVAIFLIVLAIDVFGMMGTKFTIGTEGNEIKTVNSYISIGMIIYTGISCVILYFIALIITCKTRSINPKKAPLILTTIPTIINIIIAFASPFGWFINTLIAVALILLTVLLWIVWASGKKIYKRYVEPQADEEEEVKS